jgi:nucleotide-binding universal stress UspA family protein
MSKPVIAAIDPRHEDVAPAALGAMLARLLDEPLLVVTAYPVDLSIDNLLPDYRDALAREAGKVAGRVAQKVDDARIGVSVSGKAVDAPSSIANALHSLAHCEDASVLVLGSSRRGAIGRVLPSAVTDRLLHGAPCPVAIAPTRFSMTDAADGPKLIGAAYTDSRDGQTALAMASLLAGSAHARVRVLTVGEPLGTLVAASLTSRELELALQAIDEAAQRTLQRGIDALPAGRSAGGEKLSGPTAERLAAASPDFDLLVCGSRGHGPIRTLMLGGTSHELVRKAACPVLVVPRGTSVPADTAPATQLRPRAASRQ